MNTENFYDDYWKSNRHISHEWDDTRFQKVLGRFSKLNPSLIMDVALVTPIRSN